MYNLFCIYFGPVINILYPLFSSIVESGCRHVIADIFMSISYILCMRTTIRIDDNLLTLAKKAALDSRSTLTAIIEDALKEKLFRKETKQDTKETKIMTLKGKGLLPGVDLDDSSSLLELMEE